MEIEQEDQNLGSIQIPKILFHSEEYKKLSVLAKTAYGFMKDRTSLSKANGDRWIDNQGNTFIYFTVKELAERFQCSEDTAGKIMKELESYNLIVRTRQGQGKPCRVVVNNVHKNAKQTVSRTSKKHFSDPENIGGNKTNKNNKYYNNYNNPLKRVLDGDEIIAARLMANSDDYLQEIYGNNG